MKRLYGSMTNITVVKETSATRGANTGAALTLEGMTRDGKKATGTVYLVKENGAWKLFNQESWQ